MDEYKRIWPQNYYLKKYGIPFQRNQRLSFKTAYDILLNKAIQNKELLKQRLDEVYEKHKEQILELEK